MLAERIAKARKEILGLTQRELSIQLDVEPAVVSRWERGVSVPKAQNLRKLAALAGVPIAWFYQEEREAA